MAQGKLVTPFLDGCPPLYALLIGRFKGGRGICHVVLIDVLVEFGPEEVDGVSDDFLCFLA